MKIADDKFFLSAPLRALRGDYPLDEFSPDLSPDLSGEVFVLEPSVEAGTGAAESAFSDAVSFFSFGPLDWPEGDRLSVA